MKDQTPAEKHDWLVQQGAERYVDVFLMVMKHMAQGGRTPGITVPSRQELLDFYHKTTPAYWQALATQAPEEAQSQVEQFAKAEG